MITDFGYMRIGTAVPFVRAGDIDANVESMMILAQKAVQAHCDVVIYPELCITAYTCADLFQQQTLLKGAESGLAAFMQATIGSNCIHVVGLPLVQSGRLFNCAAVVQNGAILGIVPKIFIPGHREYYEPRWFAAGDCTLSDELHVCGVDVPFGSDLLFREESKPVFCFGIEICEDAWAPIPPSSRQALAGATVMLNISASNELIGKADYRTQLIKQQSAACLGAYAYCSAGVGESTTDLVFGGHCLIAENGKLLLQNERFDRTAKLFSADVDLEYLEHERYHNVTFNKAVEREFRSPTSASYRIIEFQADTWTCNDLQRPIDATPFIPAGKSRRSERCREIFALQSNGLATRLQHTGIRKAVIGVSGGLDSTLALLVTREAFTRLDLDPADIHGVTMPGFGTSKRTLANVTKLCEQLQVSLKTIDIRESCEKHLREIGHDTQTPDITYENAQARERMQILMDLANMLQALVIGTGDLSELALGWCTYNGDHMSMYAVNSGVPKTLVQFLITYFAETRADATVAETLLDVLQTPISPELLPPDKQGLIAQKTEDVIGPYELHDFFLFQMVRCGFTPEKTLFLAQQAFTDQYSGAEIKKWLRLFYDRFFRYQFKRSCLPDGPKVGTIALSPRGDWRMPSDASAASWLTRLD